MKRTVQMKRGNITAKKDKKGYGQPRHQSKRFHLIFIPHGDRDGGVFVPAALMTPRSLREVGGVRVRGKSA